MIAELRSRPITVAEARRSGLRWKQLQARQWRRMSRGQYAWSGLKDDIDLKLKAAEQRLPARYSFSGLTGFWILGLDVPACQPIEATIARDIPVRARSGIKLRRADLPESEIIVRRGFRTTNPLRTVCDLGSRRDLVESVVCIDMALHARIIDLATLMRYVDCHAGAKGIRRLRRAVGLADARSESPMETRLRIHLITGGLPSPDVQAGLHDSSGRFIARVDLYYPDVRLVVEFDGHGHRDRLESDLKRQNALVNAGYDVLRFTAADLSRPGSVVAQVREVREALSRRR